MSDTSSGKGRAGRARGRASANRNSGKRTKAQASEGVLANLPRTRPQRPSARRDAARSTTGAKAKAAPPGPVPSRANAKATSASKPTPSRAKTKAGPPSQPTPTRTKTKSTPSKPAPARVKAEATSKKAERTGTSSPRQAAARKRPAKAKIKSERFQERAPKQGFETEGEPVSGPVQPPGGVDLFASAAELAGELTKTGLSTGGRLLKDVFSRLPRN